MLGKIIIELCKGTIGLSRALIKLSLHGPRFTLQNGTCRREEGISSEHEDFLNDLALFRATGAESAALLLCVLDPGARRRVWLDFYRHHLRAQGQGPGCRAAL